MPWRAALTFFQGDMDFFPDKEGKPRGNLFSREAEMLGDAPGNLIAVSTITFVSRFYFIQDKYIRKAPNSVITDMPILREPTRYIFPNNWVIFDIEHNKTLRYTIPKADY